MLHHYLLTKKNLFLESLFECELLSSYQKKCYRNTSALTQIAALTTAFVTLHWDKCSNAHGFESIGTHKFSTHTHLRIGWVEDEHGAEGEDGTRAALVQILQILLSHGHCLTVYTVHWEKNKQMSCVNLYTCKLLLDQHCNVNTLKKVAHKCEYKMSEKFVTVTWYGWMRNTNWE